MEMVGLMFVQIKRYCEALVRCFIPLISIWYAQASKRVAFFMWTVAWEKILACDYLIKRIYSV